MTRVATTIVIVFAAALVSYAGARWLDGRPLLAERLAPAATVPADGMGALLPVGGPVGAPASGQVNGQIGGRGLGSHPVQARIGPPTTSALPYWPGLPGSERAPRRDTPAPPTGARLVRTPLADSGTTLWVDGAAAPIAAGTPVALPSGSRFHVQVGAAEASWVEMHAVNPHGVPSSGPLWSGVIEANGHVLTPRLRLEGARGVETLRLLRRSLRDGQLSEEQVQLMHH